MNALHTSFLVITLVATFITPRNAIADDDIRCKLSPGVDRSLSLVLCHSVFEQIKDANGRLDILSYSKTTASAELTIGNKTSGVLTFVQRDREMTPESARRFAYTLVHNLKN